MMLKGCVYHDGKLTAENIALNEIVMTRKGELRVLKFKIYVDGQFLYEYSADGMIVATPTGSTAYNLSAGGPIAQPDGSLIILTPICPHTLTSRTIVLGAESRIRIEISQENKDSQNAVFDGDTKVEMVRGDYIEIERSDLVTRMIKLDNRSFLDILKGKMA
jgi:NAD+ kinase